MYGPRVRAAPGSQRKHKRVLNAQRRSLLYSPERRAVSQVAELGYAKLRVTVRIGTTMGTLEDVGSSRLSDTEYRFKSCPDYKKIADGNIEGV